MAMCMQLSVQTGCIRCTCGMSSNLFTSFIWVTEYNIIIHIYIVTIDLDAQKHCAGDSSILCSIKQMSFLTWWCAYNDIDTGIHTHSIKSNVLTDKIPPLCSFVYIVSIYFNNFAQSLYTCMSLLLFIREKVAKVETDAARVMMYDHDALGQTGLDRSTNQNDWWERKLAWTEMLWSCLRRICKKVLCACIS